MLALGSRPGQDESMRMALEWGLVLSRTFRAVVVTARGALHADRVGAMLADVRAPGSFFDGRVLESRRVALLFCGEELARGGTAGKLLNGREVGGDDLARRRRQVGERRLFGRRRGSDRFVGR